MGRRASLGRGETPLPHQPRINYAPALMRLWFTQTFLLWLLSILNLVFFQLLIFLNIRYIWKNLKSHAVGMAVARPYGYKMNFVRNRFSESAARFFVIILKFIFTFIYEIKIFKKKSCNHTLAITLVLIRTNTTALELISLDFNNCQGRNWKLYKISHLGWFIIKICLSIS